MSQIAHALSAQMQHEIPEILVIATSPDDESRPSVVDGPVLAISDTPLGQITMALHIAEGDEINGLIGDIYRAAMRSAGSCGAELTFGRSEPILDESDFRVGERLFFRAALRQMAA